MSQTRMLPPSELIPEPNVATPDDIDELNRVFTEAFTDRYRRDGMVGVRVPQLNPLVWRYAIEDAGDGAFLWRDRAGAIAAFNMAHQSGREGWMGPLAVRPDLQGGGAGKIVVHTAVDWLLDRRVDTLGLETMPRTVENIGFYSRLGFDPGHLTLTMSRDVPRALLRRSHPAARDGASAATIIQRCRSVLAMHAPTYDFTREIEITLALEAGDVTVVEEEGEVVAFALWHSAPLAAQRSRDELRILKVFARDGVTMASLVDAVERAAQGEAVRRVVFRVQSRFLRGYQMLIDHGYRVRWSDLRMTHRDCPEPDLGEAIVFSNWEI